MGAGNYFVDLGLERLVPVPMPECVNVVKWHAAVAHLEQDDAATPEVPFEPIFHFGRIGRHVTPSTPHLKIRIIGAIFFDIFGEPEIRHLGRAVLV